MKRYLVFIWPQWDEPNGGALDFSGDADTKEEIKAIILKEGYLKVNILDTKTKEIKDLYLGVNYLEEKTLDKELENIKE